MKKLVLSVAFGLTLMSGQAFGESLSSLKNRYCRSLSDAALQTTKARDAGVSLVQALELAYAIKVNRSSKSQKALKRFIVDTTRMIYDSPHLRPEIIYALVYETCVEEML